MHNHPIHLICVTLSLFTTAPLFAGPAISVTTAPLAFGHRSLNAGPTSARTLTIRSAGDADLVFTGAGIAVVGGDSQFQISNSPPITSLVPGQERDVQIVFDPSRTGPTTASLEISTNASTSPLSRTMLHGIGGHFFGGNNASHDPVLWLCAKDQLRFDYPTPAALSKIVTWPDISGNGNHAIPVSSQARPGWNYHNLNGPVALAASFSGNHNADSPLWSAMTGTLSCGPAMSTFIAGAPGASISPQYLIRNDFNFQLRCPPGPGMERCYTTMFGNGSVWNAGRTHTDYSIPVIPDYSRVLLTSVHNGTTHAPFVNGRALATDVSPMSAFNDGYILGNWMEGSFFEILIFSRALPPSQRISVETYLGRKFGIGVNAGASPSIAAGETGLFTLGNQGLCLNLTQNSGTAGSLTCSRVDSLPGGSISPIAAFSPDSTSVTPSQFSIPAYWQVSRTGLSSITYAVSIDLEGFNTTADSDQLVILRRSDSSSPWTALDTVRSGTTLTSLDQTQFSEFTIGHSSAVTTRAADWTLFSD